MEREKKPNHLKLQIKDREKLNVIKLAKRKIKTHNYTSMNTCTIHTFSPFSNPLADIVQIRFPYSVVDDDFYLNHSFNNKQHSPHTRLTEQKTIFQTCNTSFKFDHIHTHIYNFKLT